MHIPCATAQRQLAWVDQINLDRALLDDADTLAPGVVLGSLDSIHLASARAIGSDLRVVVTYDQRMQAAASTVGLVVEAPAYPGLASPHDFENHIRKYGGAEGRGRWGIGGVTSRAASPSARRCLR